MKNGHTDSSGDTLLVDGDDNQGGRGQTRKTTACHTWCGETEAELGSCHLAESNLHSVLTYFLDS